MSNSIDLELSLDRRDAGEYTAQWSTSQSDSAVNYSSYKKCEVQFHFDELRALEMQPKEYGIQLANDLFANDELYARFKSARAVAQHDECDLRLQLLIDSSAPELHQLHWEALCDKAERAPLFNDKTILFSRHQPPSNDDYRLVQPRSKSQLRALIAVANPSGLDPAKGFAPINVVAEIARIQKELNPIPCTSLLDFDKQRTSLKNLIACLEQSQYDIVYLVCHGSFQKDESCVYLENNETGEYDPVSGQDLVTAIGRLEQQRPLLMVLTACESAVTGSHQALTAVGPRLAADGLPAVLAMQGRISMETAASFMPVFFRELQLHGNIERAAAEARWEVREQNDYWMPVLFTRLKSGCIWSSLEPISGEYDSLWSRLIENIRLGRCVPILGTGLIEPVLGSVNKLAEQWAQASGYPMTLYEYDSLPHVAQYVAANKDSNIMRAQFAEYMCQTIWDRHKKVLSSTLQDQYNTRDKCTPEELGALLDRLLEEVYAHFWTENDNEPHLVLARLPVPIYITANFNNVLARALESVQEPKKTPHVKICAWTGDLAETSTAFQVEPSYRPGKTNPLIYHLLGRLDEPDSIVLTEDDYFDYLIGLSSDRGAVPSAVTKALGANTLLFLGFEMEDWSLRALLRYIASIQGQLKQYHGNAHVVVQIAPDNKRTQQPEQACKYLEDYFDKADISLYLGSTEGFLNELQRRLNEPAGAVKGGSA